VVFTTIFGYELVLFSTWLCNGKGGASAHESNRVEEKSARYELLCVKGGEVMWHKLGLLRDKGSGSERWKGKRDERRMFERTRGGLVLAAIIGGPSHDNGTRYSSSSTPQVLSHLICQCRLDFSVITTTSSSIPN
jgi:hypothetical protein